MKGEMVLEKMQSWQANDYLKAHWLGTHKMIAQTLNIPKLPHGGSLRFWLRACRTSHSTWDPSRRHICVVSPTRSSSSQVESSSGFEWTSMHKWLLSTSSQSLQCEGGLFSYIGTYLWSIHIFTATFDDILVTAQQPKASNFINPSNITSIKPPIFTQNCSCLVWTAPILLHDMWTSSQYTSFSE